MKRSRRGAAVVGMVLGTMALAVAAGCSSAGTSAMSSSPLAAGAPARASAPAAGGAQGGQSATSGATADAVPVAKPDIITTGSVSLLVGRNSLEHDFDLASADAAAVGGYVSSSTSELSGTPTPDAQLTLRVPATALAKVLAEVDALGKVQDKQLQGQDVTGQVVDLGARIANLDAEQVALRQLMGRTGSIPDILTVENQLFSVEQQLEELTAQQDSLAEQVALSTLTVELNTPALPPAKAKAPQNAALRGVSLAVHNTAAALHGLALAVGAAFPAIVLVALVALTALAWRRRRPSPRTPEAPAV